MSEVCPSDLRERVERQDDVLLPTEVREPNLLTLLKVARQLEVRGHFSNFWHKGNVLLRFKLFEGAVAPLRLHPPARDFKGCAARSGRAHTLMVGRARARVFQLPARWRGDDRDES